ncbi:MAG: PaaI family thioesterase [Candidatus Velthaea sp.]
MSRERAAGYEERGRGTFPGFLGLEVLDVSPREVRMRLPVRPEFLAPNGYLHAGTVVTLADTACGYGTFESLPAEATSFTTIELKANFLGTVREGALACVATVVHGGRTTQVWDAVVTDAASGKVVAMFRCTQLVLYPR